LYYNFIILGNPQQIKYWNLSDLLENLPEKELKLVNFLREIIFKSIPECGEKLAYNVPFYYLKYRVCYIWPASVPWGGLDEGVALGFCKGGQLSNSQKVDFKGMTKMVFTDIKQINVEQIEHLLFEASRIDKKSFESKN
jgi:hypothetical protein